jgi:L-alanine-DL-glutamate epimerase-like enolase superfamily enzyme
VKVTAVETLRVEEHEELIWVLVETDEGIVGTGETMPRVGPVERVVHEILAPLLLGSDPAPEPFWARAFQALAYHGYAGAELRALSAVDLALWDVVGQQAGLPVHRLLGGPCRGRVPVYNTCVTYGALRDRERFLEDAGGLARELADEGFPAMKIWPFDDLSTPTFGQRIDAAGLAAGSRAFAAVREAAGDRIDVALEGHSCWSLPAAIAIARALEPFSPLWLEDLLPAGDPAAWVELRRATSTPICGSERLFTRYGVAPFLAAGAFDVVKQDLCWTGGFTEFVKIAAMCAAHELPVAPHNCHGPVGAAATVHASAAIPNLYLMESIRSFARGFFADLAEGAPVVENGSIAVPERPGLGVTLRPEVVERARRIRSDAARPYAWAAGDPWAGDLGDRV